MSCRLFAAGVPWRTVRTVDDVRAGSLLLDVRGAGTTRCGKRAAYTYDALTCAVQTIRRF